MRHFLFSSGHNFRKIWYRQQMKYRQTIPQRIAAKTTTSSEELVKPITIDNANKMARSQDLLVSGLGIH